VRSPGAPGNDKTVSECHKLVSECHKLVSECYKNVSECHKNVSECYKIVSECHKNVSECYKNVSECHKTVSECHKIVFECHKLVSECHKLVSECHKNVSECHEIVSENDKIAPKGRDAPPGAPGIECTMNHRDSDAIRAEGLCKIFRPARLRRRSEVVAVDGVDLTVRSGETFGLIGPDGAGKTTTIRLLTGLLKPTAGQAQVLGFDVTRQARGIKARVGYMAQQFRLYGDLTVAENLRFFADVHGLSRAERAERIPRLLAELAAAWAALSLAEAARDGALAAWQNALDVLDAPQELDAQIVQARTQAALAAQSVQLAGAQLAREQLLRDQKAADSLERRVADFQVQAAEAALAAAQVDEKAAQTVLNWLWLIRGQPLALVAQARALPRASTAWPGQASAWRRLVWTICWPAPRRTRSPSPRQTCAWLKRRPTCCGRSGPDSR
jgi:ABC-type branched-subunit amino acid transport system ATPase component